MPGVVPDAPVALESFLLLKCPTCAIGVLPEPAIGLNPPPTTGHLRLPELHVAAMHRRVGELQDAPGPCRNVGPAAATAAEPFHDNGPDLVLSNRAGTVMAALVP